MGVGEQGGTFQHCDSVVILSVVLKVQPVPRPTTAKSTLSLHISQSSLCTISLLINPLGSDFSCSREQSESEGMKVKDRPVFCTQGPQIFVQHLQYNANYWLCSVCSLFGRIHSMVVLSDDWTASGTDVKDCLVEWERTQTEVLQV